MILSALKKQRTNSSPSWRFQGISEMASDREQRWRLLAHEAHGGFESHPISPDADSGAISDVCSS